jgi:hypothetical protein
MTDDARNAFSTVAPFGTGAFELMRLTGSGLHPRLLALLEARAAATPEATTDRTGHAPPMHIPCTKRIQTFSLGNSEPRRGARRRDRAEGRDRRSGSA